MNKKTIKSNNELLLEFIQTSSIYNLTTFGEHLNPPVERKTPYRWCHKNGKPSGPNGYEHRKQIEKLTGGKVTADHWD